MDDSTAALRGEDRAVLRIGGADARDFLQGLITNDISKLAAGPIYAALLSPQGKYLFDFFLVDASGQGVLVDVKAERAVALAQRLKLYRLRADVKVEPTTLAVVLGTGAAPAGAFRDPRDPGLGWRAITDDPATLLAGAAALDPAEMTRRRIERAAPETGAELIPEESYILEMGFERLNGVDFRKGCYVGQEVTARMKHKTELRKGLARVAIEGPAPPVGAEIFSGGRPAGTLLSRSDDRALAYLRFDRAGPDMSAGDARVRWIEEAP